MRRERIEFFDTRVTGREEIWQTLRAALEVLWAADEAARNSQHHRVSEDGGPSEEDPVVALATAQSIIDAADITLPTGDLYNGAYDAFGNYYQLSHQVVADPSNLLRNPSSTEGLGDAKTDLAAGEETEREYGDDDDDDEIERRREEKGKAVVDIRDQITIRARLSDGSRDVSVVVSEGDSARRVARAIAEKAKVWSIFGPLKEVYVLTIRPQAPFQQKDTHCLHGEDSSGWLFSHGSGLEARSCHQRLGV